VFVDDPDGFIDRAVAAGADGSADKIRDHHAPWGIHRQGGFADPFGHLWLVGDRYPLGTYELRQRCCRTPGRAPRGFCRSSLCTCNSCCIHVFTRFRVNRRRERKCARPTD
jgi:hypothetical protein